MPLDVRDRCIIHHTLEHIQQSQHSSAGQRIINSRWISWRPALAITRLSVFRGVPQRQQGGTIATSHSVRSPPLCTVKDTSLLLFRLPNRLSFVLLPKRARKCNRVHIDRVVLHLQEISRITLFRVVLTINSYYHNVAKLWVFPPKFIP